MSACDEGSGVLFHLLLELISLLHPRFLHVVEEVYYLLGGILDDPYQVDFLVLTIADHFRDACSKFSVLF